MKQNKVCSYHFTVVTLCGHQKLSNHFYDPKKLHSSDSRSQALLAVRDAIPLKH